MILKKIILSDDADDGGGGGWGGCNNTNTDDDDDEAALRHVVVCQLIDPPEDVGELSDGLQCSIVSLISFAIPPLQTIGHIRFS